MATTKLLKNVINKMPVIMVANGMNRATDRKSVYISGKCLTSNHYHEPCSLATNARLF